MSNRYYQLSEVQRYQLSALSRQGISQSRIAIELGVSQSTISREMSRNKSGKGYRPKWAQAARDRRKFHAMNARMITPGQWANIETMIREDHSPEQISGTLTREGNARVCHASIYRHVRRDKTAGGDLWTHLRCQKRSRKRYGSGTQKRGKIKGIVSIDKRASIVKTRSRYGDLEADLIVGKNQEGAIITLVDRVGRTLYTAPVNDKTSDTVTAAIIALLKPYKHLLHTITFDNGKEFSQHRKIGKRLGVKTYFAHPHHPWERGTNENTNGLLRQYYPKGMSLLNIDPQHLQIVTGKINNRPRKIHQYTSNNQRTQQLLCTSHSGPRALGFGVLWWWVFCLVGVRGCVCIFLYSYRVS
jgi:IS30 family transposase